MTEATKAIATKPERRAGMARAILRVLLGAMLTYAGISHLTFARREFLAQVPPWLPMNPDTVVVWSGVVEILLGLALMFLYRQKKTVGLLTAAFFICIFPGNIAQYMHHRSAFGLDSEQARLIRLLFQPVLVAWAVWSTRERGTAAPQA